MMLVLVIGLMASAATAQVDGGGFSPVGIYTGVETADGTCDPASGMCYGNTSVMNSYGEWETHHLTVSLNYVAIPNHNGSGSGITGGSWSLVVFRDNAYAGTLYGNVSDGAIVLVQNEKEEATSKQVQISLRSTGGLGIFSAKEYENLSGAYEARIDLRTKETSGSASFNF